MTEIRNKMPVKYLPVRKYIHDCFKNFPWASESQFETIWNYADHQLAGRDSGRKALLRSGMTPLTDRILEYQLKHINCYLDHFKQTQIRHHTKIDKRMIHQLAFDDVCESRAGQKVFASSYHYNHSQSSIDWGQVLVDVAHVSDHVLNVDYQPYLPQPYLDRGNRPQEDFATKIEIVEQLFLKHMEELTRQGLDSIKIWASFDCWYASETLTTTVRQSEVNFSQGLKKDTRCVLFGELKRLDEVFKPADEWHYRTNSHSSNRVYFQEKKLLLNCHGWCKVFAVRRGNDPRIRYYATNRLKIAFEAFLPRLRTHWQVETMHHNLKQYFNFRGCYSGEETLNRVHWQIDYLLYLMFRQYQWQQLQQGVSVTIPQLIALYRYQYDEVRAYHCFSSPKKRFQSKKALLKALC